MIPLIDADIIVYSAGFMAQRVQYTVETPEGKNIIMQPGVCKRDICNNLSIGGRDLATIDSYKFHHNLIVDPEHYAFHIAKKMITGICDKVGGKPILYLTSENDRTSFRRLLAVTKPYKGQRKEDNKPVHYGAIREYLIKNYNTKVITTLEADDALAITHVYNPNNTVVCSLDKDLLQVPGKHYRWKDQQKIIINEYTGAYNLFIQMLMGDRIDNIPGIPGFGMIKSKRVLDNNNRTIEGLYNLVEDAYDRFEVIDRFSEIANLVFLRREKDQTFEEWYNDNKN